MNVIDKIRNGDYKLTLSYPTHPRRPAAPAPATATSSLVRAYADALDVYDMEMEAWRSALNDYNSQMNFLARKFRADLEAEHDMAGHTKAEKLYSLAYEHGHSSGYEEIAYWYEELVDLVK